MSKLKRCPECGIEIAKDLEICFNCGHKFTKENERF
jgi:uncharacterized membrane protein YvbJ